LKRNGYEIVGSCNRELDREFWIWQLADGGGIERVQLRVESPAVKRSLLVYVL
jgi:hypothetical protein